MEDGSFDRWEIPKELRHKMVTIAREFRKQPTKSEAILWKALRGKKFNGVKFRRQQPIGLFVVDFFAPAYRLILEVDGPIHANKIQADRERQNLLEALGFIIIRINADDVENNLENVLAMLRLETGMNNQQ